MRKHLLHHAGLLEKAHDALSLLSSQEIPLSRRIWDRLRSKPALALLAGGVLTGAFLLSPEKKAEISERLPVTSAVAGAVVEKASAVADRLRARAENLLSGEEEGELLGKIVGLAGKIRRDLFTETAGAGGLQGLRAGHALLSKNFNSAAGTQALDSALSLTSTPILVAGAAQEEALREGKRIARLAAERATTFFPALEAGIALGKREISFPDLASQLTRELAIVRAPLAENSFFGGKEGIDFLDETRRKKEELFKFYRRAFTAQEEAERLAAELSARFTAKKEERGAAGAALNSALENGRGDGVPSLSGSYQRVAAETAAIGSEAKLFAKLANDLAQAARAILQRTTFIEKNFDLLARGRCDWPRC
jgi:hypothetical protein